MRNPFFLSLSLPFLSKFPCLPSMIITLLLGWLMAQNAVAGNGATITIQADGIDAVASVSNATNMQLRVAGPGDFYEAVRSENSQVQWYAPEILKDGEYRYEVFVTVGDEWEENKETTRLYRDNGRFIVKDNVIIPWQEQLPSTEHPLSTIIMPPQQGWLSRWVHLMLTWVIPSAQAADLTVGSTEPRLYFNDSDTMGDDWLIRGGDGLFQIHNYDTNNSIFLAFDSTPFFLRMFSDGIDLHNYTASGSSLSIDENSGLHVFDADANGDIGLADGSVFIDKSTNRMGIGTITPQQELHITGSTPAILFEDVQGIMTWTLNNNVTSTWFDIHWNNGASSASPFTVLYPAPADSFFINTSGNIGMGTSTITAPLHLKRSDGTAQLLIEEASGSASKRQLFRLINNGVTRFSMENTSTSTIWDFLTNNNAFAITKVGTGGAEFMVNNDGSVQMGPGSTTNFNLASNGNLTIAGVLTENSDINAKENVIPVQGQTILAKLEQLPIARWNYKDDDPEYRHVGPMAQDFYRIFGLGEDDKHIATLDMAGVALAGIKELKKKLREKDITIAKLNERLVLLHQTNEKNFIELEQSNKKRVATLQVQLNQLQATLAILLKQTKTIPPQ